MNYYTRFFSIPCIALALLTLASCSTLRPPAVEVEEDAQSGIGLTMTPEDLEHIRRTVPGGDELTVEEIEAALSRLEPGVGKPSFVPPEDAAPALNRTEQLRLHEQRRGRELSSLRLETLINGAPAPETRHTFRGHVDSVDKRVLRLRDTKVGHVHLDFSWTTGLDFSVLSPREDVTGAWGKRLTPSGEIAGVALNDRDGLFFATEIVLGERILERADILPFDVRQNRDDAGGILRERKCSRLYTPDVSIWNRGEELILVPHGEKRAFSYRDKHYLIWIVKSLYLEEKPCSVSFEESPWQLEYILRRIDDATEIDRLAKSGRVDDVPKGVVYPVDDVSPELRSDSEANLKFPIDDDPEVVPVWDRERGFEQE